MPLCVVEMFGLIRGSTWSPEKNSPVRSSAKQRWPGVWPGRVDGAQPPAGEVGVLAVLQQPVRHGHAA